MMSHILNTYSKYTSNWLRFVNCARTRKEVNVEMHQCYGKIFYQTTRYILPGEELLIYYGDNHAQHLNIDITQFSSNETEHN